MPLRSKQTEMITSLLFYEASSHPVHGCSRTSTDCFSYAVQETWKSNFTSSKYLLRQHAMKVVSDNLELMDFAIGLVNSVHNLPSGQVKY